MPLTEVDFVARADGWFEIRSLSPSACLSRFLLQRGFCFDDWLAAALATDQLRRRAIGGRDSAGGKRASTYLLAGAAAHLVQTVTQVMEYFEGPDAPTDDLRRVRTRISQWLDNAEAISDYCLAFADLELRELLADEARNSQDVWTIETLPVDPRQAVETVLQRLRRRAGGAVDELADPETDTESSAALADSLRRPNVRLPKREVG